MATFEELSEAIQKGNANKAKELTTALLADKKGAGDVLNKGLLDGMEKINICVGYNYEGKVYDNFPTDLEILNNCKPVYLELAGWKESTVGLKDFGALPANAQAYIKKIEELLNTGVDIISTGRKRDENIVMKDQF